MKLTILGSGTTVPTIKRAAPGYLLEVEDKLYLLDSGEGIKRRIVESGNDFFKLDRIFYTHTHVDHVAELPAILWAYNWAEKPRTRELPVYGPQNFSEFFNKMLDAMWPQFKANAKYEVPLTELANDNISIDNCTVKTRVLDRQSNTLIPYSIGYRFEHIGSSFVFTGDVGNNKEVVSLARDADVLLIDAAVPELMEGHLTPEQAGVLAQQAGVKKLILTHFYPMVEKTNIMASAQKGFKGEIILAEDFRTIMI